MGKNKERVYFNGVMGLNTKEILLIIKFMEMELIHEKMEKNTQVIE